MLHKNKKTPPHTTPQASPPHEMRKGHMATPCALFAFRGGLVPPQNTQDRLCAFDIARVAGVDDEEGVLFDEEGNLDFESGFEASAFGGGGDGIAFDGGFAFDDAQGDGVGDLQADGIAVMQENLDFVIFADELEFVLDHVTGHGELLVRGVVHEDVVLFVFVVEVLAWDDFKIGDFNAILGLVCFLEDLFGTDIFGLEFDEGGAAACGGGLNGGFEDGEGIAVEEEKGSFFEIDTGRHESSCKKLKEARV